mmetsp:Transcript_47520/g.137262  ORF Transcript_47520/g.137262 Transcript_47520/m.137262 type:complete len:319 (+) Transcript_47520:450-1406(+)
MAGDHRPVVGGVGHDLDAGTEVHAKVVADELTLVAVVRVPVARRRHAGAVREEGQLPVLRHVPGRLAEAADGVARRGGGGGGGRLRRRAGSLADGLPRLLRCHDLRYGLHPGRAGAGGGLRGVLDLARDVVLGHGLEALAEALEPRGLRHGLQLRGALHPGGQPRAVVGRRGLAEHLAEEDEFRSQDLADGAPADLGRGDGDGRHGVARAPQGPEGVLLHLAGSTVHAGHGRPGLLEVIRICRLLGSLDSLAQQHLEIIRNGGKTLGAGNCQVCPVDDFLGDRQRRLGRSRDPGSAHGLGRGVGLHELLACLLRDVLD